MKKKKSAKMVFPYSFTSRLAPSTTSLVLASSDSAFSLDNIVFCSSVYIRCLGHDSSVWSAEYRSTCFTGIVVSRYFDACYIVSMFIHPFPLYAVFYFHYMLFSIPLYAVFYFHYMLFSIYIIHYMLFSISGIPKFHWSYYRTESRYFPSWCSLSLC